MNHLLLYESARLIDHVTKQQQRNVYMRAHRVPHGKIPLRLFLQQHPNRIITTVQTDAV